MFQERERERECALYFKRERERECALCFKRETDRQTDRVREGGKRRRAIADR